MKEIIPVSVCVSWKARSGEIEEAGELMMGTEAGPQNNQQSQTGRPSQFKSVYLKRHYQNWSPFQPRG